MVTEQKAIEIAQAVAHDQGWPWMGSIFVDKQELENKSFAWTVKSNAHAFGCNVLVSIDASDGSILSRRFWPR